MSNKMKHTPGPWKWYWRQEDGEANCGVFAEPSPGHAYSVCRAPSYATQEEWDANARLIAEAGTVATETGLTPRQLAGQRADLLEALTGLVAEHDAWNEAMGKIIGRPVGWSGQYLDQARTAIAKATGNGE